MVNKKTWIVNTTEGRFEVNASNYQVVGSNLHFYDHDRNNNNLKEDVAEFAAGHWAAVWIKDVNVVKFTEKEHKHNPLRALGYGGL